MVNNSTDALRTMLQLGVDSNQSCAVTVGSILILKQINIIIAVHEDNTCDIVECNGEGTQSRVLIKDVQAATVNLLTCALLKPLALTKLSALNTVCFK